MQQVRFNVNNQFTMTLWTYITYTGGSQIVLLRMTDVFIYKLDSIILFLIKFYFF